MPSIGDVIRITAKGIILGEQVRNVFFYVIDTLDAGIDLIDIVTDFATQVMDFVHPVQIPAMAWEELEIENLTNGVDVATIAYINVGSDAGGGPTLPSYTAAGIKLSVGSKLTRSGSKRLAGIGEARVVSNNLTFVTADQDNLEDALAAELLVIAAGLQEATLRPVIVGRDLTGGLDLAKLNDITEAIVRPKITTQNSRKQLSTS